MSSAFTLTTPKETNIMYPNTAVYIPAQGYGYELSPKNGKSFSWDELVEKVGTPIEVVPMPDGMVMVCNEEGKLNNLPLNMAATIFFNEKLPVFFDPIAGDVIFMHESLLTDDDYGDIEPGFWSDLDV
jgi:hypothetical protein